MTPRAKVKRACPTRREAIAGLAVLGLAATGVGPASAEADQAAEAITALTGGAKVSPGRVVLVMPELAENGNSVSVRVTVESPMTVADHVKAIHIVSEKNPIARVASFHLGPRAGRAEIHTNIRLATTQVVTALAEMSDGRYFSGTQEVVVTLAACLDPG